MTEAIGFWITFAGWVMLLCSVLQKEEAVCWFERRLHVPWYVQVLAPAVAVIMMMIGSHVWCVGNQGRYPGYPLDTLIRRFQ